MVTRDLPEFVALPGGEFLMGSDAHRPDERSRHRVRLRPFRVAPRPVSNAEYAHFVAAAGAEPPQFADASPFDEPRQPVVGVSWFEAVRYCDWLAGESGLPLRLPTEAEREYAARGGREGDWPWGEAPPVARPGPLPDPLLDDWPELTAIARRRAPHVPTASCANGYGLLCMAENVHEWCSDWYAPDYYAASPVQDPRGPGSGRRRASRGGAWRHQVKFTRVSARSSLDPAFHYNDYGFRLYADG